MGTARLPRSSRGEPREVAELKKLKAERPELAQAADLQLALMDLQRRVQARVSHPWIHLGSEQARAQLARGRAVLRFEEIPIDWTDLGLMVRQTSDILRRFDVLSDEDYQRVQALARSGRALEPLAARWYNLAAAPERLASHGPDAPAVTAAEAAALDEILTLAMRPFLYRCAEVLLPQIDGSLWAEGHCPVCGGEPEFGAITAPGERDLLCSRCAGRWRFPAMACPFCGNAERGHITSFASADGQYRVDACELCRRYVKAHDARRADRPLLPPVDRVATLPLDAAALQKGYVG